MGDDAPKSAYELAMERLRKKDQDEGITAVPLTAEQRAQIAEVRNFYEAKIAEQTVLHESTMRRPAAPPRDRAPQFRQGRQNREDPSRGANLKLGI